MASFEMILKLIRFMKHLMLYIVLAVVMAVSGHVLVMAIPALLMMIGMDALAGVQPDWWLLAGLLFLAVSRGLLRYGEHYFGHYVAFRVLAEFRNAVFAKLRVLAPNKLTDKNSGDLLKMIGEDIEALEVFFAHTLAPVLTGITLTILLMIYDWMVHPLFALIALVTYALLTLVLPKYFANHLQPLLKEQGSARRRYSQLFVDSLKGMRDLVQLQKVSMYFDQLNEKSIRVNDREKQVTQASFQQMVDSFLVVGVSIVLVAVLFVYLVLSQQLTLETAVVSLIVYTSSFAAYLELNRLPLGFKRAILAGERVFALLEEEEEVREGQETLDSLQAVALEDVQFAYAKGEASLFEPTNITFQPNRITGIIGPSGSGKSTLMKLVMNWLVPTSGEVLLNGHATTSLDDQQLQKQIAYIPQIPQLFHRTLRDNLRLANTSLTDEVILEVAEKCNVKEVILKSEKGLDTIFNPANPQFSAGEMQRLELTRALLKQADCYIFDEPTSHLDSLNEAEMLAIIKEYCQGYIFIISHRMSSVAIADDIYQVDHQRITKIK